MLYPLSYGGDGGSIPAAPPRQRRGLHSSLPGNSAPMATADKAWIKVDKLGGKAKEQWGKATRDRRLQVEGRADQMNADVRSFGEKVKDSFRGKRRRRR
ncbi:hypothetical protein BH11ACT7_BH11ACT7_24900 [soil metagenome]